MGVLDSKYVPNTVGTRPLPVGVTERVQRMQVANASNLGKTLWPPPATTGDHIVVTDIGVSVDTASYIGLWQGNLDDYEDAVTADGAVHLWRLDDTSGAAVDAIGSLDLTAVDAPTYSATSNVGVDGSSISFDGTTDGFKVSDKPASTTLGAIETWVWRTSASGSAETFFAVSDEATSTTFMYSRCDADGLLRFAYCSGGSYTMQATSKKYLLPNQAWTHIVWEHDGTGLKLYINGERAPIIYINGSDSTVIWYDDIYGAVDNTTLALHYHSSGAVNLHAGRLACVAWYDAALTAAQWRKHYALGAPLWGPHYFAANSGVAQTIRTQLICEVDAPIYVKIPNNQAATIEVAGYETT